MTLLQLEAVCAVAAHGMNMSAAAAALGQSQPTLSRHIQNLERELGADVFVRTRNRVVALTPRGEDVLRIGRRVVQDMKAIAAGGDAEEGGGRAELRIATTHLHARYLLPRVVSAFAARHRHVALTLRQGDPVQCGELVAAGEADIGVTTVADKPGRHLVAIPAWQLPRCVLVPRGHPLARRRKLTLAAIAEHPIVAYSAPYSGRDIVDTAFAQAGLDPRIVCSAIDADVSKTYVDVGMGIAILAGIAYDPRRDRGLTALPAGHLFAPSVVNVVIRRHGQLGAQARAFLTLFAPHLDGALFEQAAAGGPLDRTRLAREAPVAGRWPA